MVSLRTSLLLLLTAAALAAGLACAFGAPAHAPPRGDRSWHAVRDRTPVAPGTAAPPGVAEPTREPPSSPSPAAPRLAGPRSDLPARVAPPAVVVTGRVRDESGRAVAGARVALWPRTAAACDAAAHRPACAIAGADGTFSLQLAAPLPFAAVLRADGVAPPPTVVDRCIAAPCVDVGDLVLAAGGELVGSVVTADGAPVGGAAVRLVAVTGALAGLPDPLRERAATAVDVVTGPDGGFAFARLAPGAYAVEVVAAGCARTRSERFAVPAGERTTVPPVVLGSGHELRGVVLGSRGEPAAAAVVAVTLRGGRGDTVQALTDARGAFAFPALPAGPLVVRAVADGCAPAVCAGVEPSSDLVVRLGPGARIRGVVAGHERARAPLRVRVRRTDDLPGSPAALERQQLRARFDAAALVLATSSGDAPALAELAAVARARRDLEGRCALRLPCATTREIDVDRDGTFACDGLASGVYTLAAVDAGGPGPATAEVIVVAGAEAFVALAAPAGPMSAAR